MVRLLFWQPTALISHPEIETALLRLGGGRSDFVQQRVVCLPHRYLGPKIEPGAGGDRRREFYFITIRESAGALQKVIYQVVRQAERK